MGARTHTNDRERAHGAAAKEIVKTMTDNTVTNELDANVWGSGTSTKGWTVAEC